MQDLSEQMAESVSEQMAESVVDVSDVLGQAPAAVLLVDLARREVVHVNPVAEQLAPGATLPARLDAWSDAAELRDLDGGLLSETDHPLSRVARSEPVTGQAVTAARSSDMGGEQQSLWVVAIPMRGAPVLDGHALVVMLPIRLRDMVQAAREKGVQHADLRSRAVLATGLSFTVADASDPDLPLVWVNPAFTETTGYTFDDAVGRSCRFLQGAGTDPREPARIREALEAGRAITTTLLNYRKDGSAYWNQLNISPIRGQDGELTHFVGIQTDVSSRIAADRARDAALEAERFAREAAEAAERRLQLMADTSNHLSGTLDIDEGRQRLLDLLIDRVADFVIVLGVDDAGEIVDSLQGHADPAHRDSLRDLVARLPEVLVPGVVVDVLLGRDGRRLLRDVDTPSATRELRTFIADEAYLAGSASFDTRSLIVVPLPGREHVTDVLLLGRGPDRDQFDRADLDVAADLGRRAGLILENARLYQVQRRYSEVLQRSLLPDLPTVEGVRAAARYHAGSLGAEVGGDFYELTALDDGMVALAVGDVIGHDMLAAAAMGHLKGLLRACVHDTGTTPARVLRRVDSLLGGLRMQTIASMLQAFLRPVDGGWEVTWSSAGHPPLVVRRPDGSTSLLSPPSDANDPLIGIDDRERRDHTAVVPSGSIVLGYTDGLVERRGESLDLGLHRLLHQVSIGPTDPTGLVEHVVEALTSGGAHDDDVAVVAVALDR